MTVIAWDGTTLAADRMGLQWGLRYGVTKIFRHGDTLYGTHGVLCDGLALVEWHRNGADIATHPKPADKEQHPSLLVIRPGLIQRIESNGHAITVEEKLWAEGAGRDFALAAMHLGLDARSAVEFASRFVDGCGNGVDTLSFDEPVPQFCPPLR